MASRLHPIERALIDEPMIVRQYLARIVDSGGGPSTRMFDIAHVRA